MSLAALEDLAARAEARGADEDEIRTLVLDAARGLRVPRAVAERVLILDGPASPCGIHLHPSPVERCDLCARARAELREHLDHVTIEVPVRHGRAKRQKRRVDAFGGTTT